MILPLLLALVTRKHRYKPDIIWSENSWTHNIFRVYELFFWRKIGIRAESSTEIGFDEFGNKIVTVRLYTFEAICAHIETLIRNFFKVRWFDIRIESLKLALPVNTAQVQIPIISFAIALDAASVSTDQTASPITVSHTCTGSNGMLVVGSGTFNISNTWVANSATYNSVAMTKAKSNTAAAAASYFIESSIWLKGGPATGSNTVSVAYTGTTNSPHGALQCTSYTGAQSSSTADATGGTDDGSTGGSQSFTVTTVADNCWIYALGIVEDTTPSIAANQTSRGTVSISSAAPSIIRGEDTNAAQTPAGGKTMGFTYNAAAGLLAWCHSGASFAPAGGAATTKNLAALGVGG